MPTYKLLYFNARGRAENARMMFTLAGVEFEDYRFKEGEWPTIKADTARFPLGQSPSLIVDGKPIIQSRAINRFVARELGFYGANNQEATKIDMVCETLDDISNKMIPIHYEKDEEKKAKDKENLRDNVLKQMLAFLNKIIKNSGGSFFVGSKTSLADISLYNSMEYVKDMFPDMPLADVCPDIAYFLTSFENIPAVAQYLKSRPQTPF
ncbi:S-crystallin SL11-like [Diadema setosum]|uniref:S-crystallin SL11-like n=1 Tax=Diadema setosum TaxID=31175 RepID=UPI003B3AFC32